MKQSGQSQIYPSPSQAYGAQGGNFASGRRANYGSAGRTHQPGPGPSFGGASTARPVGEGEIPLDDGKNCSVPEQLQPTAPPIQTMERIPGYEELLAPNVAFVPPPPSYQEAAGENSLQQVASTARLTEDEARDLLIATAESKCCWGTGAAQAMIIKRLQQSTAVHYVLKTFVETRSTDWASEPFRGQMIDGPHHGPAPSPWEIPISTPNMFHDAEFKTEVPHTASVRVCHGCLGSCFINCRRCMGWGYTRCRWCKGRGYNEFVSEQKQCNSCEGGGRVDCRNCDSRGRLSCPTCKANGKVKCFVQMTTKFKTHQKDFILERSSLPSHLIREVRGTTLFEDTQPLLKPIESFPEPQVNAQSASIIQQHRGLAKTGRIWMQSHVIRGVPVFQCDCQWKENEFQFFVYGVNRQVYSEDYPQTCCCGCQLL